MGAEVPDGNGDMEAEGSRDSDGTGLYEADGEAQLASDEAGEAVAPLDADAAGDALAPSTDADGDELAPMLDEAVAAGDGDEIAPALDEPITAGDGEALEPTEADADAATETAGVTVGGTVAPGDTDAEGVLVGSMAPSRPLAMPFATSSLILAPFELPEAAAAPSEDVPMVNVLFPRADASTPPGRVIDEYPSCEPMWRRWVRPCGGRACGWMCGFSAAG